MKKARTTLALAGAALTSALIATPASALELLVPAYFYPTDHVDEWQQLNALAASQQVSVIVNPDSGAGKARDPNFVDAINALRSAGGKVYGYVGTREATRKIDDIQAEIDDYLDWYAIDGVFIDEVPEHAARVGYYQQVRDHIDSKSQALGLIGNPGTVTDQGYVDVFDTLVIYEDSALQLHKFEPPPYSGQYDASRFAMLVYGASEGTMESVVDEAAANNVGFIYATNTQRGSNLWLELPTYLDTQAAAVAPLNIMTPVPEPSVALMMLGGLATVATVARRRRRR